ncbi:Clavaminate synthase-like protein [Glarea lozoyensis ATCC 20868]|uniref:Clavaminate synthase-like protein n=1 Tax=Glarea lozoyensis (strain ATCC 20868 / MF5171) TaxID=1116229 RepID=S3D8V8_GLAL2|nr:Clavaminate synthase-like protein [Glarea lozoyensis ATCC 20868]EPE28436.1 Clavaminate synthase-like protein [Glarea lozoyensis ATCC 20868]
MGSLFTTPEYLTIAYEKLLHNDLNELATLRKACERDGFFYIDLRDANKQLHPVENEVPLVFKAVNEFFKMDEKEKNNYDIDTIAPWKLHGHTPAGRNSGLAGAGEKHGVEAYTLPRDGMSRVVEGQDTVVLPPILQKESSLFTEFMSQLHIVALNILRGLDQSRDGMGSREGFFASKHRPSEPSTSCLLLVRYGTLDNEIPKTGLAPHTDVGSLTVLFADKRGLQARHPDTGEWQYLEPREGCAVINIGDSLRFMSQKNFQSALHRVIPTPGTTIHDRFSCAYFLRPELDAEFDAEGQHWKSIDWHLRKYKSYRSGQTGKTE